MRLLRTSSGSILSSTVSSCSPTGCRARTCIVCTRCSVKTALRDTEVAQLILVVVFAVGQSYDMNVGALFLTGFLSSVVFGNLVGPLVDKYGRRKACLVYCALEVGAVLEL